MTRVLAVALCWLTLLSWNCVLCEFFQCPNSEQCLQNTPLDVCEQTRHGSKKILLPNIYEEGTQWLPGTIFEGLYYDCDCVMGAPSHDHRIAVLEEITAINYDPVPPTGVDDLPEFFNRINKTYTPDAKMNFTVLGIFAPRYIMGEYFLVGKPAFTGGSNVFTDIVIDFLRETPEDPNLWQTSISVTLNNIIRDAMGEIVAETKTRATFFSDMDFADDCSVQVKSHFISTPDSDEIRENTYDISRQFNSPESRIARICQTHEFICVPAGFPQYDSLEDCLNFYTAYPDICDDSPNYGTGDQLQCRFLHLVLIQLDPFNHCPHIGKKSLVCAPEACDVYDEQSDALGCNGQRGFMRISEDKPLSVDIAPNWFGCCNQCRDHPLCQGFNFNSDSSKCYLLRDDVGAEILCDGGASGWVTGPKPQNIQVPEEETGECAEHCGAKSKTGCYCDDQCYHYGDCCEDVCNSCGLCHQGDYPEGFEYPARPTLATGSPWSVRTIATGATVATFAIGAVFLCIRSKRRKTDILV